MRTHWEESRAASRPEVMFMFGVTAQETVWIYCDEDRGMLAAIVQAQRNGRFYYRGWSFDCDWSSDTLEGAKAAVETHHRDHLARSERRYQEAREASIVDSENVF